MGNGLCVETSSSWTVFDWLDKVVGTLGSYSGLGGGPRSRKDDDIFDKLSHHYTTIILVIFTVIVSTKQYAGEPIQCWCPAQFTDAHVLYTNQVCWISNTYYIPMENVIPTQINKRKNAQITYYQWVPMILLFMALMFKIPRMVWKTLTTSNTMDLDRVVSLVYELQMIKKDERDEKLNDVVDYLSNWLETAEKRRRDCCHDLKQRISRYSCLVCGRRYGNYFMTSKLLVKALYFINAFLHYFALNAFLGKDFAGWGFQIINGLADDNPEYIKTSPRFPRVTLCDFEIRQMNNLQRWTVQCVLPINLFNSKIFLFVWFWILFLCVCSLLTFCAHFYVIIFPMKRLDFVKKILKHRRLVNTKMDSDRRLAHSFVMDYLKFDGVYVLRLMSVHATEVLTAQIAESLFLHFKRRCDPKQMNGGDFETV